jgi:hypothetical protein
VVGQFVIWENLVEFVATDPVTLVGGLIIFITRLIIALVAGTISVPIIVAIQLFQAVETHFVARESLVFQRVHHLGQADVNQTILLELSLCRKDNILGNVPVRRAIP